MKKQTKSILMIILAVILVICLGIIGSYYYKQVQAQKLYEEMQSQSEPVTEVPEVAEEPAEEPEEVAEEEAPEIPVDFAALQEQNPDIYAWIEIPGTVVDYPILRNETETDYYLDRTPEKVSGLPGSIYTQNANAADFSDPVTVIYGHNMKNGSMFGALHDYEDADFFKENQLVYIYTPEHILTYQIFAAIIYDNRLIIKSFDFSDETSYGKYLASIYDSRNMVNQFNEELEVTTEDRIITLSTCVGGHKEQRYLVQAVLIDEQ